MKTFIISYLVNNEPDQIHYDTYGSMNFNMAMHLINKKHGLSFDPYRFHEASGAMREGAIVIEDVRCTLDNTPVFLALLSD